MGTLLLLLLLMHHPCYHFLCFTWRNWASKRLTIFSDFSQVFILRKWWSSDLIPVLSLLKVSAAPTLRLLLITDSVIGNVYYCAGQEGDKATVCLLVRGWMLGQNLDQRAMESIGKVISIAKIHLDWCKAYFILQVGGGSASWAQHFKLLLGNYRTR